LQGRFDEIIEIPREIPAKARGKKKFADSDPFRGEKPGKTQTLGDQYRSSMRPFGVKTMANGAKIARPVAGLCRVSFHDWPRLPTLSAPSPAA
jgi:hypothetical protein